MGGYLRLSEQRPIDDKGRFTTMGLLLYDNGFIALRQWVCRFMTIGLAEFARLVIGRAD